jgi:hypothetical protein
MGRPFAGLILRDGRWRGLLRMRVKLIGCFLIGWADPEIKENIDRIGEGPT